MPKFVEVITKSFSTVLQKIRERKLLLTAKLKAFKIVIINAFKKQQKHYFYKSKVYKVILSLLYRFLLHLPDRINQY